VLEREVGTGYEKMNEKRDIGYASVYEGTAANMSMIGDGEVDLVLSSPPYFSKDTEELLKQPVSKQLHLDQVQNEITSFAMTLRPAFKEISRILRPGGALVFQTKDIRYGGFLMPLVDTHCELALQMGLRLVSRLYWLPTPGNKKRRPGFAQSPRKGTFRTHDVETFLIMSHSDGIRRGKKMDFSEIDIEEWVFPVWRCNANQKKGRHPHGSPQSVIRRFIELFTEPGDLVVDPFCGFGTTLEEAASMRRHAIGYDVDHSCVVETEARIQ
jgi:DNA modification methylase